MKKLLLITLVTFTFQLAFSQIVFNRSDLGQPGDTLYYAYDTTYATPISIGAAGANKTWDFSTGISPDITDLVSIHDASFDPTAPSGTNLILTSQLNAQLNFHVDSLAARVIVANPIGVGNINLRMASFPMTYNANFSDSTPLALKGKGSDFGFSQVDSIWIKINVISKVSVDGWGSLITKTGTYDVLRSKNTIMQLVDIYGKGLITLYQWIKLTSQNQPDQVTYSFLAKNSKYFIAQATVDSLNNLTRFSYIIPAPAPTTGLKNISANAVNFEVYPNPANAELNIHFSNAAKLSTELQILDLTGKVVMQCEPSTNEQLIVNTSSLPNGIYLCRLQNNEFVTTHKIIINR